MNEPLYLTHQPWMEWPELQRLVDAFSAERCEIRYIGGCVRDSLLERPVREVDLATPMLPEAVMGLLSRHGMRGLPTGIAHGTVTALVDEKSFEITTLRRDVVTDGRHAEVEFTRSWEEDAQRRDFTINSISVTPDGRIHDYCGGLAHLNPIRLIFIGNPVSRITEDALRMLRFFRFAAQLSVQEGDAEALDACEGCASMLGRLSGERISQEMLKLLAAPNLSFELLREMDHCGMTPWLLLPPPPPTLAVLPLLERRCSVRPDPLTRLVLWLKFEPDTKLAQLLMRWKLSGLQRQQLFQLRELSGQINLDMTETLVKKLLRKSGREMFVQAACVSWAVESKTGGVQRAAAYFEAMIKLARSWQVPVFPLTGQDLLNAGFSEGRQIGELLKELETEWEASSYRLNRGALMERVVALRPRHK